MSHNDVRQSPAYLLWLVNNAWQREVRRQLEPWDLTHVQFFVMSSIEKLGAADTCLSQAEVARFLDIDENMTSQVIRSLEQRGMVVRSAHDSDRRARSLTLTEEGLRITLEARTAVRDASAKFYARLGSDEAAFVALLTQLLTA